MNTIRSIPVLALLLGLTACASNSAMVARSAPYCPKPGVVADLQQAEGLAPDGQVEWTARLSNLASNCEVREFDYTLEMDVTVDLRTGPAFKGGTVDLAYFVAVATPDGDVIDKQTFPVILEPTVTQRRSLRRETLRQRLPLTYREERAIWSVLVGFEPTAQQVRERAQAARINDPAAPDASGSGQ